MKRIKFSNQYDSNLSLDIKMTNQKFNFIKRSFVNYLKLEIAPVLIFTFIALATPEIFFGRYFLIASWLSSLASIYVTKQEQSYFYEKKEKANESIAQLTNQLQKQNKNISKINIQHSIVTTKIQKIEDFPDNMEQIVTDYSFLDKKGKIQVLRMIRENICGCFADTVDDVKEEFYLLEENEQKKLEGLARTKSILESRRR